MARSREIGWEEIVLFCTVLLAVIFIAKIIFWISVIAFVVGVIWIAAELYGGNSGDLSIPIILILGGLAVGFVSYQIGYGFEQSAIGKPIVDGAKTIVEADNNITAAKNEVNRQLIEATMNVAQNGT